MDDSFLYQLEHGFKNLYKNLENFFLTKPSFRIYDISEGTIGTELSQDVEIISCLNDANEASNIFVFDFAKVLDF